MIVEDCMNWDPAHDLKNKPNDGMCTAKSRDGEDWNCRGRNLKKVCSPGYCDYASDKK